MEKQRAHKVRPNGSDPYNDNLIAMRNSSFPKTHGLNWFMRYYIILNFELNIVAAPAAKKWGGRRGMGG